MRVRLTKSNNALVATRQRPKSAMERNCKPFLFLEVTDAQSNVRFAGVLQHDGFGR